MHRATHAPRATRHAPRATHGHPPCMQATMCVYGQVLPDFVALIRGDLPGDLPPAELCLAVAPGCGSSIVRPAWEHQKGWSEGLKLAGRTRQCALHSAPCRMLPEKSQLATPEPQSHLHTRNRPPLSLKSLGRRLWHRWHDADAVELVVARAEANAQGERRSLSISIYAYPTKRVCAGMWHVHRTAFLFCMLLSC